MARLANDGEPTYGKDTGDKDQETKIRRSHHFSDAPAGQLSPAGDEPPIVRSRLSEDGTETANEALSPTSGVASSRMRPE